MLLKERAFVRIACISVISAAFFVSFFIFARPASSSGVKLLPPAAGIYHSANPHYGTRDDDVSEDSIKRFEDLVNKRLVWSYFSFHWDRGMAFPSESCRTINRAGVVPLVGFMPWSSLRQGRPEPIYTLARIISGDFDATLRECAIEVRSLGFPVMIEFGPEANGSWFPWSAAWNGRGRKNSAGNPEGPARFAAAYRHIIDIFREENALNVTWVFHVASSSAPDEPWNRAEHYYPGDGYIDWIGVSVYGRLKNGERAKPFDEIMKKTYPELVRVSGKKPIAVLELGVSEHGGPGEKARWIADAYRVINSGKYPGIKAVAWWNKKFRPDGTRSALEVDISEASLGEYGKGVAGFKDEAVFSY